MFRIRIKGVPGVYSNEVDNGFRSGIGQNKLQNVGGGTKELQAKQQQDKEEPVHIPFCWTAKDALLQRPLKRRGAVIMGI